QASEQDRRGDAQFPARRGTLARGGALDLLEVGEHAARARHKPLAGLGEADRAGGAVEKSHPEPHFELANRTGNRGRRASEPTRSRGKTASLGDLDKGRDALDATHGYCIYRNNLSNEGILSFNTK